MPITTHPATAAAVIAQLLQRAPKTLMDCLCTVVVTAHRPDGVIVGQWLLKASGITLTIL
jgi:hypothetical protein